MLSKRSSQKSHSGERGNKNYMNYISFNSRETDHAAKYTLNLPENNSNRPVDQRSLELEPTISRDAYLKPTQKEPELNRNGSQQGLNHQRNSQDYARPNKQVLKNTPKHNSFSTKGIHLSGQRQLERSGQQFYTQSSENFYSQPPQKNTRQPPLYSYASPNFSRTADIGAVMRNNDMTLSVKLSRQGELLKQRLEYLQTLERLVNDFEKKQDIKVLRALNRDNRLLLIQGFEEAKKLKAQSSTKDYLDSAISVSQSDNFSEDGMSIADQSDRSNSVRIQQQKYGINDRFGRQRDRSIEKGNSLVQQNKLNQQLQQQYEEQLRKRGGSESELKKLDDQIEALQNESAKMKEQQAEIAKTLKKLPFYQEWNLMCREEEGAKKTKIRLEEEIEKRKTKVRQLKSGISSAHSQKNASPQNSLKRQRSAERPFSVGEGIKRERSNSRTKLAGFRAGVRASEALSSTQNSLRVPAPLPLPRPHSMNTSNK